VPLAPSFDTVGWLAASAARCAEVGAVLLDGFVAQAPVDRLIVLDDVVAPARLRLDPAIAELAGALGATVDHATLAVGDEADRWREAFRVLQGAEAWATHGAWITAVDPELGPAVRARFEAAARITGAEVAAAATERERLRRRLDSLLGPRTALVVPAAAGPPLPVDADDADIDRVRAATLAITCLASLAGLPATAQPTASGGSLPLGLSLLGRWGADESLLASLV
jgi:amidase